MLSYLYEQEKTLAGIKQKSVKKHGIPALSQ